MAAKTMNGREDGYPIFCPYCMRRYWASNVVFRKKSEKLNSSAGYREDSYLAAYNSRYGKRATTYLPGTVDPAYLPEAAKTYDERNGMLVSVRDVEGNNWIAAQRICPYCHNRIVRSAGLYQTHVLTVVGFREAGKTAYEAALLDAMADKDKFGVINVSECENPFALDSCLEKMKSGAPVLYGTEAGGPFHYQITLRQDGDAELPQGGGERFLLSVVTLPGEQFRNPNALKLEGRAIQRSDTCVFLIDPENMEASARMFEALTEHYSGELSSGRVNVAVVLNRADRLNDYFPQMPLQVPFRQRCSYENCAPVSMGRINTNHEAIALYAVQCQDARGNSSPLASLHSALVEHVAAGHFKWFAAWDMRDGQYAPNNVEEPLLWSLAWKGMYPKRP